MTSSTGGAGGFTSGGAGSSVSGSGGRGSGGAGSGGAAGGGGGSSSGGAAGGGGSTGGSSSVGGATAGGSSGAAGSTAGTGGTPGTGGIQACPSLPGAPAGTAPLPTAAQLAYQRMEMNAFLHYSLATYDGSEQGSPNDSPSIFNPSNLNATSVAKWVTSLKEAGFRQALLVAKHSVGFALWPSKYTDYSVKASPWMNGQGDVVKLFSDAMYANDMRPGYYLAPWDQKYPSTKSDYETYLKNQAAELLAYGPMYEIWFDGANSSQYSGVNWKTVFQAIHQSQPNLLIWAGPEMGQAGAIPDLQWIGSETGFAKRSTSSLDTTNCGGTKTWCPYECDVSSHASWFWHSDSDIISVAHMQDIYFQSVGMNCTLLFNVPPSKTGEFSPADLSLLQQFAQWYAALYKTNFAKGQSATADSTWAAAGFEASKAVDDDICSYWAAASGKTSGRLEVALPSSTTANVISIREAIELGERVKTYHVELKQNGTWNTSPTDKSGAKIQGTVIGNRQLWQLGGVKADAVALVIDSAKDAPAIAEFDVY
jgi:alpha-L-fucosidase